MRSETISIPVTDKVSLAAVIHYPSVVNNKVLIVSHGFRGSKESGGRGSRFGDAIAKIGFTVVRFDFTPCQPLSSQVTELQNIIQWSCQHLGREIYLLGRSMGGSASLLAAPNYAVAGLCLWAAPADLAATFRRSLGNGYEQLLKGEALYHKDEWGELILLPDFIQDFKHYDLYVTMTNLAKRNTPLLLLHGSHDTVVSIEQAERLFSLAGHPKKFVIIEDGDHQFTQHYEIATDAVVRWLEERQ